MNTGSGRGRQMSESNRTRRWKRERRILRLFAGAVLIWASFYLYRSVAPFLSAHKERLVAARRVAVRHVKGSTSRPVYPYSIIPGGAYSKDELIASLESDSVASVHYAGFRQSRARIVQSTFSEPVFLSYRIANKVYWTSRRVPLPPGESLLSDGENYARARCGNRISLVPQTPIAEAEPAPGNPRRAGIAGPVRCRS